MWTLLLEIEYRLHLVSVSFFIISPTTIRDTLPFCGQLVIIIAVIRVGHKDNNSKYPNYGGKSHLVPTKTLGGLVTSVTQI